MRDLKELNINEGGRPVTLPKPTLEQLAEVERLVGASLPASYVEFLMFSNGGGLELNTYQIDEEGGEESINVFFHVGDYPPGADVEDWESVEHNYKQLRDEEEGFGEEWPREVLPIADNGLGDLICLDLAEEGYGSILLWLHEEPDAPFVYVAESLEEFVDSLYQWTEDEQDDV